MLMIIMVAAHGRRTCLPEFHVYFLCAHSKNSNGEGKNGSGRLRKTHTVVLAEHMDSLMIDIGGIQSDVGFVIC